MNRPKRRWCGHGIRAIAMMLGIGSVHGQDMDLDGVLISGEGWQLVASGYRFTEGPAADNAGNVYFTDIPNNRIHKVDTNGKVSVFVEPSHGANGLMFGRDGRLYACQNGKRRVVAYDANAKEEVIASDLGGNDLVVAGDGGIYVTDPGAHQVWYINPQREKRVVAKSIEFPNGVILWPDQGTLVVANTRGPALWTFRVEADGSLTHQEGYYDLRLTPKRGDASADGMTVDQSGRLYVATALGIQMFDPIGRLGGIIHKPQNAFLSNITFGGSRREWLYVTCSDKVYRRKTKSHGVLYLEHKPRSKPGG